MGSQPQVSDTRELKDKAAQEIMDVLPAKGEETSETAATREPSEKKEYIVKDLEPEIFGSSSEFKPFHVEGAMKTAVKVQAPKSQPIKEEDINPELVGRPIIDISGWQLPSEIDYDVLSQNVGGVIVRVHSGAQAKRKCSNLLKWSG